MSNLALNKLPLEKKLWKNAEIATNGDILNYDPYNGFADAPWPCDYTIDLGEIYLIKNIRFLLWDNLGAKSAPDSKPNSRRYNFTLSVSGDNENYVEIFSNKNKEGGNGWYSFNFLKDLHVRYVKFTGHFNSANAKIHIVEFEVHDKIPPKLDSKNVNEFDIITDIPNEQKVSELINQAISKKSEVFQGIEEKMSAIEDNFIKSRNFINQYELIKETHTYEEESLKNKKEATCWLRASIAMFVIFFAVLIWSLYWGMEVEIIDKAVSNLNTKPFANILLGAFFVTKALIISTVFFILGWTLKNYRSVRHNYVINKHKAMTLTVGIGILNDKKYDNILKEEVFNKAVSTVVTHQPTGFTKGDDKDSSVTESVIKQIIKRSGENEW